MKMAATMTTSRPTSTTAGDCAALPPRPGTHKVVIVNGSPSMAEQFESVLSGGHYDVVFVESTDHAYSHIKRVQPNLVILCTQIEDMDGLQVLSMLKLDKETCDIPVLTYASDRDENDSDEDDDETTGLDVDVFSLPVIDRRMN